MSEFLCVGDVVSLYCEETEGYVYNCQTRFVQSSVRSFKPISQLRFDYDTSATKN